MSSDPLRWLNRRLSAIVDAVIGGLAVLAITYIASNPATFNPKIVSEPTTVVILVLSALIVSIAVVRIATRRSSFIKSISIPSDSEKIDLERLSLSQYIKPDPLLVDKTHRFSLIEQTVRIEGTDNLFTLRYKGTNASKNASRFFRDAVTGDSAVDSPRMEIKAWDNLNKIQLNWKLLKDEPYEKLFEIYFQQALDKGADFDIEVSGKWPGTFTRKEDYVFYPIHFYKRGVEKFVGKLILDHPPTYLEGIRIVGRTPKPEGVKPLIGQKDGKHVVVWEIEKPKHIYILQFGRQDI